MTRRPVIASAWLKADYRSALESAGADVRELSPADPLPDALAACDGLLLTGGADVDPREYGDVERHPTLELDAERDRYELTLAREALRRNIPTLAICRGAQVLNVAAGGTLLQDIASAHPEALNHQQTASKDFLAHPVDVAPSTCLAALLQATSSESVPGVRGAEPPDTPRASERERGTRTEWGVGAPRESVPGVRGAKPPDQIMVNSRHHQAIRQVAPGFVVSATAPDGIVEAIEKPDAAFCVAVQWHPENFWATGRFAGLFTGLVRAAALWRHRQS
jgi:putative glutamine amidotransferase